MKKKFISLLLVFVLAFSSVMMVSAEEMLEQPTEWADALTTMSGADAISHIGDENAVFSEMPAYIFPSTPELEGQGDNAGFTKLTIYMSNIKDAEFAVKFIPIGVADQAEVFVPLSQW